MLADFQIILFDEQVGSDRFLGFTNKSVLTELPLWGNYKISDILNTTNLKDVPHTIIHLDNPADGKPLHTLLGNPKIGKNILIGRIGNLAILDWVQLAGQLRRVRGIAKVQVGKIPSDLYCLEKGKLKEIVTRYSKRRDEGVKDLLYYLFTRVLFDAFERIVDCSGFSFHVRNSYEYFIENLMIIEHLKDKEFVELYKKLRALSVSNTVVSDKAVIRNSYLGNGSVVHGVVENSVIFSGVTVGRNSTVRNSVILPSNRVGEDVRIENTLVLGGKDRTIEHGSSIGGDGGEKNGDYPLVIKKGLTVIGESINIPPRSRIGSGCLVYGRLEHGKPETLKTPLDVKDGETFHL